MPDCLQVGQRACTNQRGHALCLVAAHQHLSQPYMACMFAHVRACQAIAAQCAHVQDALVHSLQVLVCMYMCLYIQIPGQCACLMRKFTLHIHMHTHACCTYTHLPPLCALTHSMRIRTHTLMCMHTHMLITRPVGAPRNGRGSSGSEAAVGPPGHRAAAPSTGRAGHH